jgi:nucleoside-diphosphate-sugar epimerase
MADYLVTGAAGFIGAALAERLLDDGHRVTGVDNLNDAYDLRLKEWRLARLRRRPAFVFQPVDITDRQALAAALGAARFDAIFNLAARAGVRPSLRKPEIYFETNVDGALNLLEAARTRGVPKFVQASTSSLYGAHNPRPFSETADTSRPLSPYAASKGAAELLCHSYHYLHGLDVTILRYFTVYGPAGRPDMSLFRFIQWICEDRPLLLYGDDDRSAISLIVTISSPYVAAVRPLGFGYRQRPADVAARRHRPPGRLAGSPGAVGVPRRGSRRRARHLGRHYTRPRTAGLVAGDAARRRPQPLRRVVPRRAGVGQDDRHDGLRVCVVANSRCASYSRRAW